MQAKQCHPLRFPCAACVLDGMAGNGRCGCTSLVSFPQQVCDAEGGRPCECEEDEEKHHAVLAVDRHAESDSSLNWCAVSKAYPDRGT